TQKQFGSRNKVTVGNHLKTGSQSKKRQNHSSNQIMYSLTLRPSVEHCNLNNMKRTPLYRTYYTVYIIPLKLMILRRLLSYTDWGRLQMVIEQELLPFLLLISGAM